MTPLTREWVKKAEDDYDAALKLWRGRKRPNYNGCAFHAQQCVEKYLKARLQEAAVPFPKTHQLANLLPLISPVEPQWVFDVARLDQLSKAAVEVRYPGASMNKADAKAALATAKAIRMLVRRRFRLRV